MGQNKHEHAYSQALPLERFDIETLRGYWDATPSNPTVSDLVLRAQIETEVLFHPEADEHIRKVFRPRRIASDKELMSCKIPPGHINSIVTRTFAPLLLDLGEDGEASRRLMQRRARRVFDLCEDIFPEKPETALGLCAETFFNLVMNEGNTAANPSLGREDKGWKYEGVPYSWDSTVVSIGAPPIAAGVYRTQIKYGDLAQSYHPDIALIHINPRDEYHVPGEAFVDFARLLLPGTKASQKDLDKLNGRIHSIHKTLQEHGPSNVAKIVGRCLVEAA